MIAACFPVSYTVHHESIATLEVNGFLVLYNIYKDTLRVYSDLPMATYKHGLHVPRTSIMILVSVPLLYLIDIDKSLPTRSFSVSVSSLYEAVSINSATLELTIITTDSQLLFRTIPNLCPEGCVKCRLDRLDSLKCEEVREGFVQV